MYSTSEIAAWPHAEKETRIASAGPHREPVSPRQALDLRELSPWRWPRSRASAPAICTFGIGGCLTWHGRRRGDAALTVHESRQRGFHRPAPSRARATPASRLVTGLSPTLRRRTGHFSHQPLRSRGANMAPASAAASKFATDTTPTVPVEIARRRNIVGNYCFMAVVCYFPNCRRRGEGNGGSQEFVAEPLCMQ